MKILFQSLDIDPVIYFTGSDEEIAEAEKKEARQAARIEKIISRPDFQQLTYTTAAGAIRSLHRSTRQGVKYQLSYIDPDGIPAMHENYISTGADPETVGAIHTGKDLVKHFINQTFKKPLQLELITC